MAYETMLQLRIVHNPYAEDPQDLFTELRKMVGSEPIPPELDKSGLESLKAQLPFKR